MAARRLPHRHWLARRRRFQDARGAQVTHIWLNIPLLPRHIRVWRSPDRRVSCIQVGWFGWPAPRRVSPVRLVIFDGILLVFFAMDISHDVITHQWMSRIPEYLLMVLGMGFGNLVWWRDKHQPQ